MPRPAPSDPPTKLTLDVPESLLARLELILWDPVRQRPRYGARKKVVCTLLERWVAEQEARGGPTFNDQGEINV